MGAPPLCQQASLKVPVRSPVESEGCAEAVRVRVRVSKEGAQLLPPLDPLGIALSRHFLSDLEGGGRGAEAEAALDGLL